MARVWEGLGKASMKVLQGFRKGVVRVLQGFVMVLYKFIRIW